MTKRECLGVIGIVILLFGVALTMLSFFTGHVFFVIINLILSIIVLLATLTNLGFFDKKDK